MREYKEAFLPSGVIALIFFSVSVLLTIYFFITLYTASLITSEGSSLAVATQNNIVVKAIFFVPWASWIDRALDFAFWGAIAALFLITIWSLSAVRVSLSNHHTIGHFNNFKESKTRWHESFIVEIALKTILIFSILYLASTLLFRFVPELSTAVAKAIQKVSAENVVEVVIAALCIFGALYATAMCIKIYQHIQAS